MGSKFWKDEEIQYIKENYNKLSTEEISKFLNRTTQSVYNKANKLELKGRNNGSWRLGRGESFSQEQKKFIQDNYVEKGLWYCSEKLNLNKSTVIAYANSIGLKVNMSSSLKNSEKFKNQDRSKIIKKNKERTLASPEEELDIIQMYIKYRYSSRQISFIHGKLNSWNIVRVLKKYGIKTRFGSQYDHHGSKHQFGEKNHAWKGGIKAIYSRIRDLKTYKDWRTNCIIRDNRTCQDCGTKKHLQVHHKITVKSLIQTYIKVKNIEIKDLTEEDLNNPFFFNLENGITLCVDCHKKVHKEIGKKHKIIENIQSDNL